jgi:hypothetical protein
MDSGRPVKRTCLPVADPIKFSAPFFWVQKRPHSQFLFVRSFASGVSQPEAALKPTRKSAHNPHRRLWWRQRTSANFHREFSRAPTQSRTLSFVEDEFACPEGAPCGDEPQERKPIAHRVKGGLMAKEFDQNGALTGRVFILHTLESAHTERRLLSP